MGFHRSTYIVYGMQIERLPDELYWKIQDEQQEKVTDNVRLFSAGDVDADDHFLVTSIQEGREGHPFLVPPYAGTEEPYLSWDAELVAAAEKIGAKTMPNRPPGWMFIGDVS